MRRRMQTLLAAAAIAVAPAGLLAQKQAGTPGDATLAAPAKQWAARTSPSEITVVWQPVKGATAYAIHARKPDGSTVKIMQVAGATVGRIVIPVARLIAAQVMDHAEHVARLFIVAVDGPKASTPVWFNEIFVGDAKAAQRPAAPANVQLRETSAGVLTLTWDEVPGATGYTIGRASGNEGFRRFCDICPTGGQLVDTVPATGVRYAYTVAALSPAGPSPRATSPAVTPTGGIILAGPIGDAPPAPGDAKDAAPGAPTQLKSALVVDDKGARRVRLSWVAGVRTGMYEIYRSACNGPLEFISRLEPPPITLGVFPTMEFMDRLSEDMIRAGCNLAYELKGLNPKGAVTARFADVPVGTGGSTGGGTVGGTGGGSGGGPASASAPPPPANPVARAVSGNEVRLTWSPVAGATGYRIERALGASTYQPLATLSGDATSYSDARTGLVKQNPKYRISAVNAAGASAAVSFP